MNLPPDGRSPSQPTKGDTREERDAIFDEYMQPNATRLAARAWKGYNEQGRGLVGVLYDQNVTDYLDVPTIRERFADPEIRNLILDLVRGYNPQSQFVIYFGGKGWPAGIAQILRPTIPPPLAEGVATYVVTERADESE